MPATGRTPGIDSQRGPAATDRSVFEEEVSGGNSGKEAFNLI